MSHTTLKSGYTELVERLNRFPQGAPPSDTLYKILQILFSEKEAQLVALLPIKPFGVKEACRAWKVSPAEARKVLDELASRAILVDVERDGEMVYTLPPPMAGFFEFSMMRVRGDIDQRLLSELFYEYITVEEDFMRALLLEGETPLGRVFVNEPAIEQTVSVLSGASNDAFSLQVLDYECASEVIRTAEHRGISLCYCRHKKQHIEQACDKPLDICMTFGGTADSLIRHGYARRVDQIEGRDLLQQAYDLNLVQFGDNVRDGVAFICNCCGCCCEAMIGLRKYGAQMPIHSTSYQPRIVAELCNGCGKCVKACPVEALELAAAPEPSRPAAKKARLHEDACLGCGVCPGACPKGAIALRSRAERWVSVKEQPFPAGCGPWFRRFRPRSDPAGSRSLTAADLWAPW